MYWSKKIVYPIIKFLVLVLLFLIQLLQAKCVPYVHAGELICGVEQDQQSPAIAYADADSYLIVWQDYRSGVSFDIYGAGIYEGIKFGPIQICTVARDQKNPVVGWDGIHYLIVWEDNRSGSFYDIYGARVTKSGSLLDGPASSGGRKISKAIQNQLHPDLVWNGKDCFLVVWEDNRNTDTDIYAMRVSPDMMLFDGPAEDGGIALCVRTGEQKAPCVAWNGSNFLIVWEDHVSAEMTDIRGVRVSPAGNVIDDVWDGGIAISVDNDIQRNPDVASDMDRFLVVWDPHTEDQGYPDIYGIVVNGSGVIEQNNPTGICTAVHNQVNPAVYWTGNNYLCLWKDDRENSVDIYWTRIDNQGGLLNSNADGGVCLELTQASCIYTSPAAAFTSGKGMLAWEENYTAQLDIYGMELIPPIPPVLEWASGIGYESDGVEPDQGYGGSMFTFRVLYKDSELTPPSIAQVWIDLDGDDSFSFPDDLRADMVLASSEASADYLSGVVYQAQVRLEYEWEDGFTYRFYFKDNIDEATGEPTKSSIVKVLNNPPIISWCDLDGYILDGVDPDQAEGSFTFKFMANYVDVEGDLPEVAEVWVDLDDSGTYEQRERFIMQEADDSEISSGRNYKKSVKVLYSGDGRLNYRFLFTDGHHLALGDPDAGDPTKNHIFIVQPHLKAPILSWPSEEGFQYGAKLGTDDSTDMITFKVGYCDPDNDAPVTMELWVDLNGDSLFTEDERFRMSPQEAQNKDFTKVSYYKKQMTISYTGDGGMSYKFFFDDGWNIATGDPFLVGAEILVQSPINLRWSNETGFGTDGVNPNSGPRGSIFEFRVIYVNQNGYPPYMKELWLDEDMDGQFQEDEKYAMEDADLADFDYTDGKEYLKLIQYAGDKSGNISYRFVFNDIYMSASGPPAEGGQFVEILKDSPSPGSNDPLNEDNLSVQMLDSVGQGCFINTLHKENFLIESFDFSTDNQGINPRKFSLKLWIKMLKCSLLILIVIGIVICLLLYKFCTIRGK